MFVCAMNERGNLPRYEYLAQCIRRAMESGELAGGERVPSKRSLAEQLGVSVITVENAYQQLVAEGYLEARPRSGYYARTLPNIPATPTWQSPRAPRPTPPNRPATPTAPIIADFTGHSRPVPAAAKIWARGLRDALARESEAALYATAPAMGSLRLREAIAAYVGHGRAMHIDARNVIVAAGAPALYHLIGRLVGPEGKNVAIEKPGYGRLARIYEADGFDVHRVAVDEAGMSLAALEESEAAIAHVMPSHQFPLGLVMPISRRYELLGWAARQRGRLIVEDDYDWEFRLAGKPIPALRSIDAAQSVFYLSTFSKSLFPALRIAFAVVPPAMAQRLGADDGLLAATVPSVEQIVLARLIESGEYARHVARYRRHALSMRDELLGELARQCPDARALHIDNGLHFVLEVPSKRSASEIARRAGDAGIVLAPLEEAEAGAHRQSSMPAFVMQYDAVAPEAIRPAVTALVRAAAGPKK